MEIEEAFRKLGETLRWEGRVAMAHEVDPADEDMVWFEEEQAVVRAVCVAVLDHEHSEYRYPVGCSCTTWEDGDRCRGYREALAEIEALGG